MTNSGWDDRRETGAMADDGHLAEEGAARPKLFRALVGRSAGMQHVRRLIARAAEAETPVTLLGEAGTGKEVVARNVHYHSSRWGKPFVAVYCGTVPGRLLHTELFGHASHDAGAPWRHGAVGECAGGTLFLDEIGCLPLQLQDSLLAMLQRGSTEPDSDAPDDGATGTATVRLVVASQRDLRTLLTEGRLRAGLFEACREHTIEIPPLRERKEDLPLLISELNARFHSTGKTVAHFSDATVHALAQYHWPGNVEELANLIERCAILMPGRELTPEDLPEPVGRPVPEDLPNDRGLTPALAEIAAYTRGVHAGDGVNMKSLLETLEVNLIHKALDDAGGVVTRAAVLLGLRRTTLVEKLRKYGIRRPGSDPDPAES